MTPFGFGRPVRACSRSAKGADCLSTVGVVRPTTTSLARPRRNPTIFNLARTARSSPPLAVVFHTGCPLQLRRARPCRSKLRRPSSPSEPRPPPPHPPPHLRCLPPLQRPSCRAWTRSSPASGSVTSERRPTARSWPRTASGPSSASSGARSSCPQSVLRLPRVALLATELTRPVPIIARPGGRVACHSGR
jgi:hypothetical protein